VPNKPYIALILGGVIGVTVKLINIRAVNRDVLKHRGAQTDNDIRLNAANLLIEEGQGKVDSLLWDAVWARELVFDQICEIAVL
jgi:hypothetical protein